jgi:hypothetical protein
VIFLEIIDNKKLEKGDRVDDVYILYVKKYAIKNCNRLERWCDTDAYMLYVEENYILKNLNE